MSNTNILQLPVAIGLDGTEYMPLVQGTGSTAVTKRAQASQIAQIGLTAALPASLEFSIDGGGGRIGAGSWGTLTIPFDANLVSMTMEADQAGSITVDIRKCTYANYSPPSVPSASDSITAATPPTIVGSTKARDTTLSGWTTSFDEGDILQFYVPTPSTSITRVTVSLNVTRIVLSAA